MAYAAAVAKAYGVRACVVTAGGDDLDRSPFEGHRLKVVETEASLTFEHSYTYWGNNRKLRVTKRPGRRLSYADVPFLCRSARNVLLGPLTPEDVDMASFAGRGFRRLGLMAQGMQRTVAEKDGAVGAMAEPHAALLALLQRDPPHRRTTRLFLSDVETLAWTKAALGAVRDAAGAFIITKGEKGASVVVQDGAGSSLSEIPAVKVEAVDTNGAGDVFATSYMLEEALGTPAPGEAAAWVASRTVMLGQICKPECALGNVVPGALRRGAKQLLESTSPLWPYQTIWPLSNFSGGGGSGESESA